MSKIIKNVLFFILKIGNLALENLAPKCHLKFSSRHLKIINICPDINEIDLNEILLPITKFNIQCLENGHMLFEYFNKKKTKSFSLVDIISRTRLVIIDGGIDIHPTARSVGNLVVHTVMRYKSGTSEYVRCIEVLDTTISKLKMKKRANLKIFQISSYSLCANESFILYKSNQVLVFDLLNWNLEFLRTVKPKMPEPYFLNFSTYNNVAFMISKNVFALHKNTNQVTVIDPETCNVRNSFKIPYRIFEANTARDDILIILAEENNSDSMPKKWLICYNVNGDITKKSELSSSFQSYFSIFNSNLGPVFYNHKYVLI